MEKPQTNSSPYFCILEIRRSSLVHKGDMNTSHFEAMFSQGVKPGLSLHEIKERLKPVSFWLKPRPVKMPTYS